MGRPEARPPGWGVEGPRASVRLAGAEARLLSPLPVLGLSSAGPGLGEGKGGDASGAVSCLPQPRGRAFCRPRDPGWGGVWDDGVGSPIKPLLFGQPQAQLYCDPGPLSTDKVPVVGPHCSWGAHPCCEPNSLRRRPAPPHQPRVAPAPCQVMAAPWLPPKGTGIAPGNPHTPSHPGDPQSSSWVPQASFLVRSLETGGSPMATWAVVNLRGPWMWETSSQDYTGVCVCVCVCVCELHAYMPIHGLPWWLRW